MGGKHYEQKARDRARQVHNMEMQSRREWLTGQFDRLGLSEDERRELVTYALDHQIPIDVMLSELERLLKEDSQPAPSSEEHRS